MQQDYDFSEMQEININTKIAFIIPFKYKFKNFSNVKSHYEYLQILGYNVDLYDLSKKPIIEYNNYDQIWLMGSRTKLNYDTFWKLTTKTNTKVIAFGWSDPNMFDEQHAHNCHIYFTNDLKKFNHYLENHENGDDITSRDI